MIKSSQKGFYDLNVSASCFTSDKLTNETLKVLHEWGYRTVAVTTKIDTDAQSGTESKKKKKKGEAREPTELIPTPFNLEQLREAAQKLSYEFTFFTRLTLVFSSQDNLHKYTKSLNYKKYNIIAALPTTVPALSYCCSTLDADIISYDPENRFNLRLNRKQYSQLVERGYHFELTYSPAIIDYTKRKNLIHLSHLYHTTGKSKNIFFSSGAEEPIHLRNAYDIISLGFLFGLNEMQSKNAVSHCPRNVIVNANGRSHGKTAIMVENMAMEMDMSIQILSDEEMDTDEPVQKKHKQ
ncbi:uncharacterized protein LOC126736789 [Anthonomus grandis grandis]|uniref:uncharacterized protein LOC126736789 n=1 Tax=Anthonomus grandis grandis TaxID=2921223 RepID=UPI002166365B|nr:uncharacterized protein LOC126736789 [Anthonomus grandis grandis]